MTAWTHSDITDAADALDNTGGPGGDKVRALLKDYDRAAAEAEKSRFVAQGNKRHVALLLEAYEQLEARALVRDARDRLARHLYCDGTDRAVTASQWDSGRAAGREIWLARADELLAVITGKETR